MGFPKCWNVWFSMCNIRVLEMPKLNPHIPEMKHVLARVMEIEEDDISIKATTTEKLGFVGKEEGVAAHATVLIYKD